MSLYMVALDRPLRAFAVIPDTARACFAHVRANGRLFCSRRSSVHVCSLIDNDKARSVNGVSAFTALLRARALPRFGHYGWFWFLCYVAFVLRVALCARTAPLRLTDANSSFISGRIIFSLIRCFHATMPYAAPFGSPHARRLFARLHTFTVPHYAHCAFVRCWLCVVPAWFRRYFWHFPRWRLHLRFIATRAGAHAR